MCVKIQIKRQFKNRTIKPFKSSRLKDKQKFNRLKIQIKTNKIKLSSKLKDNLKNLTASRSRLKQPNNASANISRFKIRLRRPPA